MATLSVVVPIYNVQRYLEECLRSLAAQSLTDLQVVMVDDGSPDDSAAIAELFAETDPRFVLVRQANAGLGAARNRGIEESTGEFITFVDSDDVIPPYAFGAMVNGLRESGSDFATGNVLRLTKIGTHQSPMHRKIFRTAVRRTHITQRSTLLIDRLATNKVWRRSFWDAHELRFPEGVLYEDVSVVIPAHFLAEAVDVLSAPVYLWRERPSDDKSITQDRLHVKGLQDRFRAVRAVSDFLAERGMEESRRRWDATALGSDLRIFLQVLNDADEEFREEFLRLGNAYLDTVPPGTHAELKSIERLKWHLVRRRMLPELLEVLTFNKSVEQRKAKAVRHGTRYYAEYPFKDDPAAAVPREVYRLDKELVIRQKAEHIEWRDGHLVVSGRACLRSLRPNKRIQQYLRAWLVNPDSGERVRVPVSMHQANEFLLPPDAATARRDWGGYEIVIDPAKLRRSGTFEPGTWFVELWMFNRGIIRRDRLTSPRAGATQRPDAGEVAPGVWLRPGWQGTDGLRIDVDPLRAQITGHRVDGADLELTGVLGEGARDATGLRLTRMPGDHTLDIALAPDGGSGFTARVALADLAEGFAERSAIAGGPVISERWEIHLLHGGEQGARISLADGTAEGRYENAAGEVNVERASAGWATLRMGKVHPVITGVAWNGDALTIDGRFPAGGTEPLSFLVRAKGRMEEHLIPLVLDGSRFSIVLRPTALPAFGAEVPLGPGGYRFAVRRHLGADTWEDRFARMDHALLPELPAGTEVDGRKVAVDAVRYDVPVLTVGSALRPQEQGGYAQQQLRERTYPALREKPVLPGALLESYSGKQFSDSPRGIYEELRRRDPAFPASWI